MIREAYHKDVHEICALVMKVIQERGWGDYGPVDEQTAETLTRYYIRSQHGFVRVNEENEKITGFFIGYSAPFLLDIRQDSLHEMLSGGDRVEDMWREFLLWGREKKCVTAIIGCYDESQGSRFRRI